MIVDTLAAVSSVQIAKGEIMRELIQQEVYAVSGGHSDQASKDAAARDTMAIAAAAAAGAAVGGIPGGLVGTLVAVNVLYGPRGGDCNCGFYTTGLPRTNPSNLGSGK